MQFHLYNKSNPKFHQFACPIRTKPFYQINLLEQTIVSLWNTYTSFHLRRGKWKRKKGEEKKKKEREESGHEIYKQIERNVRGRNINLDAIIFPGARSETYFLQRPGNCIGQGTAPLVLGLSYLKLTVYRGSGVSLSR